MRRLEENVSENNPVNTHRVKLLGGPLDGKYALFPVGTTVFKTGDDEYKRNAGEKIALHVPPVVVQEPQPLPESRTLALGPRDAILVEFQRHITDDEFARVKHRISQQFPDRKIIMLDGGAKLSTIHVMTPLSTDWIDAKAREIGLTALHAPDWFVEYVRMVEEAHNIKG